MQGMILGAFVQGVTVEGRRFAGGAFDWLNAYSVMTGMALVFGYALLGATWLVMKTDGDHSGMGAKVRRLRPGVRGPVPGDRQHQHADHEPGHSAACG